MKKTSTELLETEKVGRLLFHFAVPSIIAMTAMSIYNVIDSIFIGHGVGSMALAGLAITFPFMNIMVAFSTLVAIGGGTLLSVKLGQKDYSSTQSILGNVVLLHIMCGIGIAIISLMFLNPILHFFGASAKTLPYAHDFMVIFLCGNIFTQLFFGLNAMLRSSGSPQKAMKAIIGSVLINLILNPLFIFGLKMGIQGSALATVLSQATMLCWQIKIFNNKKNVVHFEKKAFILNKEIAQKALYIGLSPFLLHLASCLIVIIINNGLNRLGGDMSVGAYGIINRFVFIFGMILVGLNQAMQPIVGFNYGAQNYGRVTHTLKVTILCGTIVAIIGFILGETFPIAIASVFTKDSRLISESALGMRLTMLVFPLVGFQMTTTNFFQSIGMAKEAIFLSLSRQLLFIVPFLLILPIFWGLKGIWLSMPASDMLATIVTAIMLFYQMNKFKSHYIHK